jgi:lipopolysaccharide/colanic/teichoic acid biosynthesis glycosyltransferase
MFGIDHNRKHSRWLNQGVPVLSCIFVAAVVPYFVRVFALPAEAVTALLHQTLLGTACAIIFGAWLSRNFSTYPGVEESSYIFPSFSVSYGLILLIFLLGRFEYNRLLLIVGYIGSVVWFYAIYFYAQRKRRLKIGLLPFGAVDNLREAKWIDWVHIDSVDMDVTALDAIATDLRIDLPNEWDRRLADYALSGLPVYHSKHLRESLTGRVELEHLSENSFGTLSPATAYMSAKHIIDWLFACVILVAAMPLFLFVGVAIRLESKGPAVFRQKRMGYQGKPFIVYKFRTMQSDPDIGDAREAAMTRDDDNRITPFGQFLRRTRIDELPQVFNILKGEMSWIGPRPEADVLSHWYQTEIPFYRYRHIVRPGITGWAQVTQGHVSEILDVNNKLYYDFYYIKNFSPWIDLLIIARTVKTMVTGFGSK